MPEAWAPGGAGKFAHFFNGSWPASPQPINDFYPGTFLKSFSLFGESETAKIDLLDLVKDWTAGQANHGLMLRGPVNRANYVPSACVKYYHSVRAGGLVPGIDTRGQRKIKGEG